METINAKIIICDIEGQGTTTSISFVKDILFPYAIQNSKSFLENNWNEDFIKQIVNDLVALPEYKEFQEEQVNQNKISKEGISNFVTYLIKKDLKLGPLKTLQGLIWDQAYVDKTIKGHVYEDVPSAFRRWTQDGLKMCIYSSGSVNAQKLLFGNSEYGNLMPFISNYFDTAIGNKREPRSYIKISKALNVVSSKILFLTDIVEEGIAAAKTKMQVVILDRPGNAPLRKHEFKVAKDFNEIHVTNKERT